MVHGAGGTLLQHLKELVLHTDLRRDDRIFYFTTCGWMMWNWLVSGLAVGATVVLYDGAPLAPAKDILWDMAAAERVTVFGTSAKYLALGEKEGLGPGATHDLGVAARDPLDREPARRPQLRLRLPAHQARTCTSQHQRRHRHHLLLRARQSDGAGVARRAADAAGSAWRWTCLTGRASRSTGTPGELVCTRPFPSMPVAFWNDPDGAKYRAAYFEHFPDVWRHGDWAERTAHDGLVIFGRSDATLNPGGVRIGTAEIYRQVEQLPEVVESLVVGQDWEDDVRIVLFVRLRDGHDAGRGAPRPHPHARSGRTPARTTSRKRSFRWPTYRGQSAGRSPSWRCGP